MQYAFPIYSREHLQNAIPKFFQRISCYRDAKTYCMIGNPRPDLVRSLSYFVARIGHRAPAQVKARQHSVKGERNNVYGRTYWRHSHYTYGVFSIIWGAKSPEMVSHHATKQLALSALRQINQPHTTSHK